MSEIREITEDTKKLLQGLAPFSLKSTVKFTPEGYKIKKDDQYLVPEELWPVFELRPWNKLEATHIKRNMPKYADSKDDTEIREYVRRIVVGWENLIDAGNGDEITYQSDPNGGVLKDIWDCFPSALVTDILNKALTISGIVDMERAALRSQPVSIVASW